MARAAKACSDPHCPNAQPCSDHQRKPWQGSTRRKQLPGDWDKRRRRVLARDPLCTDGTTCNSLALSTEVHHTGDRDDHRLEALAGVCRNCHTRLTQQQARAARAS